MGVPALVFGGAVGAAIAYFFDPVSGKGRRSRLRDQGMSRARHVVGDAERRTRYLANVAQGRVTELVMPGPDNKTPDDATLAQRIQSEVFGRTEVPKDRVSLDVVDGVATLRGELDSREEIQDITTRVAQVPGVVDVEVLMHLPGEPSPNKEEALQASRRAQGGTDGSKP
jgi:hyperosmotically inducible protein